MVSTSIIYIRHRLLVPCRRVPQREAGTVWAAARHFHSKGAKMRRLPALACRRRHGIPRRGLVPTGARKILAVAILTTQLILSQKRYALAAGDDAVEGTICTYTRIIYRYILVHMIRLIVHASRRQFEAGSPSAAISDTAMLRLKYMRCVMPTRVALRVQYSSTYE